jgi:hypothetical protein
MHQNLTAREAPADRARAKGLAPWPGARKRPPFDLAIHDNQRFGTTINGIEEYK